VAAAFSSRTCSPLLELWLCTSKVCKSSILKSSRKIKRFLDLCTVFPQVAPRIHKPRLWHGRHGRSVEANRPNSALGTKRLCIRARKAVATAVYFNPAAQRTSTVPRHREVKKSHGNTHLHTAWRCPTRFAEKTHRATGRKRKSFLLTLILTMVKIMVICETFPSRSSKPSALGSSNRSTRPANPCALRRHGIPVAEVIPTGPDRKRKFVGDMVGTAEIVGDIVSPIINLDEIEAYRD